MIKILNKDQFKTIQFHFHGFGPLNRETFAYRFLLMKILISSTDEFNTKVKLNNKLNDLYGMQISDNIVTIGNYHDMNIQFNIADERFIGENILSEAVDLIKSMLFSRKKISRDIFDDAKKLCIETLSTTKERQYEYGALKFNALFFKHSDLKVRAIGTVEDIESITFESLNKYYYDVFMKEPWHMYVCGHLDENQIDYLNEVLRSFENGSILNIETMKLSFDEYKHYDEYLPMNQTLLFLGYSYPIDPSHPLYFAASIANLMIGGSSESLLFKIFREKLGLAYDVDSEYIIDKNVLTIYANVDSNDYDTTLEKLKVVLDFFFREGPSAEALESHKKIYLNNFAMAEDYQEKIVNKALLFDLLGLSLSYEEVVNKISSLTTEDLKDCLSLLELQVSYALYGGIQDES